MKQERYWTKAAVLWLVLVAVGLVVYAVLAYGVKARSWDPFWFGQFGTGVLTTYLSATTIGLLYELLVRRLYLSEAMELARIAQSVEQAGIVRYGSDFPRIDFSNFFRDAHDVDICFCYGGTWIEHNRSVLRSLFCSGAKVRIIMVDPQNDSLIEALAKKWREPDQDKYSPDNLKGRIQSSSKLLFELHAKAIENSKDNASSLEVLCSQSDMPYSFYRADSRMIVVFTKMCRDKDYPIHFIEVEKRGGPGLYDWVLGDIEALKEAPGACSAPVPGMETEPNVTEPISESVS